MTGGRRFIARSAGLVLSALALAAPAAAQPVRLVWSTYMRAGPGPGYGVIDELQHDVWIDLQGCGAQWCRITSDGIAGYIDKDAIALARLPGGGAPIVGSQGCFVTGQKAWRGEAKTRFCETRPKT